MSQLQTQLADPVQTLELAPVETKGAIAKYAWDALPLERKTSDNLMALKETALSNPAGFVAMCQHYGLPLNLNLTVHQTTHHHHHAQPAQPPGPPGLTAADVAAIVRANQQPGITAADLAAIMQMQQPQPAPAPVVVQQGYSQEDVWAMLEMQQRQMERYQPQPVYYPPEPVYYQAPPINFAPHIEVHAGGGGGGHSYSSSYARSHSEQDNRGGPWGFLPLMAFAFLVIIVGGSSGR
jgi:hypothetical protein